MKNINHQKEQTDSELVTTIKGYLSEADHNEVGLRELLKLAEKARYNHEVIKMAAYFLLKANYNTLPVMSIAKLAGNANHEVKYLDQILEISIICDFESLDIVSLARKATYNQIGETELKEKIAYYRSKSKWKTIDEAIQNYRYPKW